MADICAVNSCNGDRVAKAPRTNCVHNAHTMDTGATEENYGGDMAAEPLERTHRSRKVFGDDANHGDDASLPAGRGCWSKL